MLLFEQMLVLFFYMMIGHITCKKKILDEDFGNKISWLVLNIANPMMIISSAVNSEGSIKGEELIITAVVAVIIYIFLLFIAVLVPKIFKIEKRDAGYFQLMTVFNNIGFMGFPVILAMYGSDALLYASVFLLPYNILFYTYGINLLSTTKQRLSLKKILNIGVIASFLAVILYLTQIPVPQFVKSASQGLSHLTAPLSMIVIGISLAKLSMKELFLDIQILLFAIMKLLFIPIFSIFIIKRIITIPVLQGVCMVMLATPAGSMTAMLAQQYGGDYKKVAQGVALTTLLSVLTIPLVSILVL
ncbi:MAG: AEC family transporter [Bacilli bacterium]|nr:AEC family transporter [Bacilli bacterium]